MDNLDVLDRDALILYLQNVRDLEVAMYGMRSRFNKWKSSYLKQINAIKPTAKLYKHKQRPDRTGYVIAMVFLIVTSLVLLVSPSFLASDSDSVIISFVDTILGLGIGIILLFGTIGSIFAFVEERKKYYNSLSEWESYESTLDEKNKQERIRADRDMQRKQALDSQWSKQSQFYSQQYASAQSLLNSFYSMNIIPVQYHNLPAVCYIYDYLSTSRETLTAALFSQQIDNGISRIEAKLGEIVDRLETQIYETRCLRDEAHRYNQQQIEQHTQMLDSLRQTEQNTQRAAQYAELGANYSKANAFFSLATYLKTSR